MELLSVSDNIVYKYCIWLYANQTEESLINPRVLLAKKIYLHSLSNEPSLKIKQFWIINIYE